MNEPFANILAPSHNSRLVKSVKAYAGFHFSKVVVIESLEPSELCTGAKVAAYVESLENTHNLGTVVEYVRCDHVVEFENLLNNLSLSVLSNGQIPLLHVECHGHRQTGLAFANGSQLAWAELSKLLVQLNASTEFNLVAAFSACYGAHFLAQLDCVEPAPCYALVAASDSAYPDELLTGFRRFYAELFATRDAGQAVAAMSQLQLHEGAWFAQRAEAWFEEVVLGYVEAHCTKSETKTRALRMYRDLRERGVSADLGQLRRGLVESNRSDLVGKYFRRYFMVDQIPACEWRFRHARQRIQQRIAELRATNRYAI